MTVEKEDVGGGSAPPAEDDRGLDALLDYLHRSRGFDFTGYKHASLSRRIHRRMQVLELDTFTAYVDHLEVHPDEFPQLFNMLLINVTGFFRDPAAWQALAARLPDLIDPKDDTPVRVWSAGCSSGEEPYTLAMILAEFLGVEAFTKRVKIYATDVDEDALAQARQATYPRKALQDAEPALVEKYFTPSGSQLVFHKDLRRGVIFGRHDLVQDAPIPRLDILSCRNALMYFNAETQLRILQRLQFALNARGLLFLGKAEMLLTHSDLFTPLDLKLRLFARVPRSGPMRERPPVDPAISPARATPEDQRARLYHATFNTSPWAHIVVDPTGALALVNRAAAQSFGLVPSDIGRPFHDLELSYRPAELRSCIERARFERRKIQLKEVERVLSSGDKMYIDIDVVPLLSETGIFLGTKVTFVDVTHTYRLQLDLRRVNVELEAAHEELQSASEELETTNEELQSTVEELETTNEELQSTNEELETMNEELQSTNEELQTINEELRLRGSELNEMNSFFSAVLASLPAGIAVLDRELCVRVWNLHMEELWGPRVDEVVGKHFLNLDIGLPIEPLTSSLRACISNGEESARSLDCTNRRGKAMRCEVNVRPLQDDDDRGAVIFIRTEQST